MEPTMQITLTLPANADNASIAAALRMRAGIFEGQSAKDAASRKNTDGAKTTKKSAAAQTDSFDDDTTDDIGDVDASDDFDTAADEDTETLDASDDSDDDFTAPPATTKKTGKAKKVTIAEVNEACKARAKAGGKEGRAQVLKILKKHFKTESISEIKPEQYGKVIQAMAVTQ